MPKFILNGKEVEYKPGETILQVAWRLGVKIPVFCYHPHLPVYAGCRMCLVEVELRGRKGLLPSCATQVAEGMVVNTETDEVRHARKSQLEFLLLNHPLECPTCDAGGECDLQNLTFIYGPTESRFTFEKHEKELVEAHPYLKLYPNRCILCNRCVSFYQEISANDDWGMFGRGHNMRVGPYRDKILDSEFSGNMIEVCPLGAITGRDYRFKSRPWEHKIFNSISPHDSIGANIKVYARVGGKYSRGYIIEGGVRGENHEILRINMRPNYDVNDPWIDDRTRFIHSYVNSSERIVEPLIKKEGEFKEADWDEVISHVADKLAEIKEKYGPEAIAGIAGGRGSNESAFFFARLLKDTIGTKNVDFRIPRSDFEQGDPVYEVLGSSASTAKLNDIYNAKNIIVFGTEIRETHPLVGLKLVKARKSGARVYYLGKWHGKAEKRWASRIYNYNIYGEVEAALSILKVAGLKKEIQIEGLDKVSLDTLLERAGLEKEYVEELVKEETLFIFDDNLPYDVQKALSYASSLLDGKVLLLRNAPNGQGFIDMGVSPVLSSGQSLEAEKGLSTYGILKAAREGKIKALLLFNVDPVVEFPARDEVLEAIKNVDFIVVFDSFWSEVTGYADAVMPLTLSFEEEGSYTNTEGRVQWAERAIPVYGMAREAWRVFAGIVSSLTGEDKVNDVKDVTEMILDSIEPYKKLSFPLESKFEEPFPDNIPSLHNIKTVYKYPTVEYELKPREVSFKYEAGEKVTGDYVLVMSHHLYKTIYTLRTEDAAPLVPLKVVEMNPETIKQEGIEDEAILIGPRNEEYEVKVISNKNLPEGVVRVFYPFLDYDLNSLLDYNGFGRVRITQTVRR